MFRFSMDMKDASIYTSQHLAKIGIYEDEEFALRQWKRFFNYHPEFDPEDPDSDGFEEAERMSGEIFFRVENIEPQNLQEAISMVQSIFFFSPIRIWLANREMVVDNYIGSNYAFY